MKESDIETALAISAKVTEANPLLRHIAAACASFDDIERWGSAPAALSVQGMAGRALHHIEQMDAKDARIAGLEQEVARLSDDVTFWFKMATDLRNENSALLMFMADGDKPEPDRRPDGTLKPAPKELKLPQQAGDARRLGG